MKMMPNTQTLQWKKTLMKQEILSNLYENVGGLYAGTVLMQNAHSKVCLRQHADVSNIAFKISSVEKPECLTNDGEF